MARQTVAQITAELTALIAQGKTTEAELLVAKQELQMTKDYVAFLHTKIGDTVKEGKLEDRIEWLVQDLVHLKAANKLLGDEIATLNEGLAQWQEEEEGRFEAARDEAGTPWLKDTWQNHLVSLGFNKEAVATLKGDVQPHERYWRVAGLHEKSMVGMKKKFDSLNIKSWIVQENGRKWIKWVK